MVIRFIIAGIAVAAVALAPRSRGSALVALACGAATLLTVAGGTAAAAPLALLLWATS